jgi:hypothetical protein
MYKEKLLEGKKMADDVIILKTSGVPLFSRCYGGKTCKLRPDHALQSGFLAALYSFSKESFGQNEIKSVVFNDMKLDFKIDEDKGIIIVFTNPLDEDEKVIKEQLDQTYKLFTEKYAEQFSATVLDVEVFSEFDRELLEIDVVPQKAKGDIKLKSRKESFFRRIFSKIFRK